MPLSTVAKWQLLQLSSVLGTLLPATPKRRGWYPVRTNHFANWTIICDVSLDVICDPSQSTEHLTRFGNREVYAADYPKWPRREEICKSMTIPVYDSPPYNREVEGSKSFRNYMEGFYKGNEICNATIFACSVVSDTTREQLHNQVC